MSANRIGLVIALAVAAYALPVETANVSAANEPAPQRPFEGSYHVTEDNAVISGLDVTGNIVIEANNVTLRNIRLRSTTPWHALTVKEGVKGFKLEDSDIDGRGFTVNAIYGHGTFLRNNIHGSENGINVIGPSMICENYIHDLRGSKDAHFDGIEINGGDGIDIINNTIINANSQTSAVMLDNYFAGVSNIRVEGNRLEGGGYTVYLDGRFNGGKVDDSTISIVDNQIGRGIWGNFALYGQKPTMRGNVDLTQPLKRDDKRTCES